jgi:hypothetical protein
MKITDNASTANDLARESCVHQFVGLEPEGSVARSYQHTETGSRMDLRALASLLRLGYCPLIGCNPG